MTTPAHLARASKRQLSEAPGLALGLEQCEEVALADGAFDVTDDGAVGVVEKLDAHLGDTTAAACAADNFGNLSELHWLVHGGGDRMQ